MPSLVERDRQVIWHPFTQHKKFRPPLKIKSAKAATLVTEDGQELLDGIASWWVNLHGHSHPKILARAREQTEHLEQVIFAGCTHEPAVQLAEALLEIVPGRLGKVFFSDNGSTSVEVALKLALQSFYNLGQVHRKNILAFRNGYHGDTFGSMSVSERGTFTEAFHGKLFDVTYCDPPLRSMPKGVAAQQLRCILERHPESFAGLIYEPRVQGAGGMLMQDPEELDAILGVAQEFGVLCIADEVMTGFGRTGELFASEGLKHTPDIVCLSKGITGGLMPLGVTVVRESIFESFLSDDPKRTFYHGHSYTANPIACAAAVASLELLRSQESLADRKRIARSHERFAEKLVSDPNLAQCMSDVRHQGTIFALNWESPGQTGYFHGIRDQAYAHFLNEGILLRPLGNVTYILPLYCITDSELTRVYDAIVRFADRLRVGDHLT